MSGLGWQFRRGDRVSLDESLAAYHGCRFGVVHAIHGGTEDTVEVRLDSGSFTCTDPPRLTLISRLEVIEGDSG